MWHAYIENWNSVIFIDEPLNDKTNKMTCAPSKDADQPGHPPSLISLSCPHEEALGPWLSLERADWSDTHVDLSLRWEHKSFCWFCRAQPNVIQSDMIEPVSVPSC